MRPRQENEIAEILASMDRRFTREQLRSLFLGRRNDTLFEYLGRVAEDGQHKPTHVYVWVGYGLAVRNSYETNRDDRLPPNNKRDA